MPSSKSGGGVPEKMVRPNISYMHIHNNHYDCKMTQKPINVLSNDNPESKVIPN
jgi:hypothetical protein